MSAPDFSWPLRTRSRMMSTILSEVRGPKSAQATLLAFLWQRTPCERAERTGHDKCLLKLLQHVVSVLELRGASQAR